MSMISKSSRSELGSILVVPLAGAKGALGIGPGGLIENDRGPIYKVDPFPANVGWQDLVQTDGPAIMAPKLPGWTWEDIFGPDLPPHYDDAPQGGGGGSTGSGPVVDAPKLPGWTWTDLFGPDLPPRYESTLPPSGGGSDELPSDGPPIPAPKLVGVPDFFFFGPDLPPDHGGDLPPSDQGTAWMNSDGDPVPAPDLPAANAGSGAAAGMDVWHL